MKIYNIRIVRKAILFLSSFLFALSVQSQELELLIEEALHNSPEIQKFELQYSLNTNWSTTF